MKSLLHCFFFLLTFNGVVYSQSIINLEYYFDLDPGLGLGFDLDIIPNDNINLDTLIDISQLENGLHHLYIRAQDSNGHWSMPSSRPLYKNIISTELENEISRLEYYVDSDPGFGKGQNIPF